MDRFDDAVEAQVARTAALALLAQGLAERMAGRGDGTSLTLAGNLARLDSAVVRAQAVLVRISGAEVVPLQPSSRQATTRRA